MRGGDPHRGRPGGGRGAPAVPPLRGRRVPGRQPDPGGAARPLARRPPRPVRGRRPGADDLLLRRARARTTCSTSPRSTRARPASSWSATTARPRRSIEAANTLLAGTADPRRPAPVAAGGRARRSSTASTPTRSTRPRPSPPRSGRLVDGGTAARRDRRAVPDQRAVGGLRGGARRARHPLRRPRGGALLPAGRGAPGGDAAARQRPVAPRTAAAAATALVEQTRAVLAGMGWTPEPPTARGNARDRWESLQALIDLARRSPPRDAAASLGDFVDDLDRRAAEQHAPVADGVTSRRCTPRRGSSGTHVFVCGVVEGTLPITLRDETPRATVEEERRLLYVGLTRARSGLAVSWALARNPGGRASRRPSRFLDGLRPRGRLGRGARAARRRRSPEAQDLPGLRRPSALDGGPQGRPLRQLPVDVRRGAVRGAARLAAARRPRRSRCRRTSCSPT